MPRQYEPIWTKLKEDGVVRLAVPRPLHKRVVKAVLKEKDMDKGFRLMMLEKRIRLRIEYECKDNVITIKLKQLFTFLTSVSASDL